MTTVVASTDAHPTSATAASTSRTTDYGNGRLMAADPAGGYWLTNLAGQVLPFGGASSFGGVSGKLNQPIVSMAATPYGLGYWLVARDGGIFSYGDAQFYGSTGSIHLNQPIVGMASTPDEAGYWLVAADGGIFAYGDAQFYGSTGSIHLNQPIVGMASTPDGAGYWLVAADGGIFAYGDAQFYGSTESIHLNQPIVAMEPSPHGNGYWLVASDGGLFTFGDAPYYGSLAGGSAEVDGIVVTPGTTGYDLVTAAGEAESFRPPTLPTNKVDTTTRPPSTAPTSAPPSTGTTNSQSTGLTVPSTIADNCTSNVTTALTNWFDSTPANTTVSLPAGACYLVNPVTDPVTGLTSGLTLNKVSGLTINGNGATFRQTAYPCDGSVDPILTLTSDTNVTVDTVTIDGPGNCPGNEGDAGIYLGQATPGNANISFDGVTIENTNGDGLDVYPQLGSCCGINTNVTYENGAMSNIGYHTIVPEGVKGLTISNNTFTNVTDMDMEVDIDQYGPPFNTCTDSAAQGLTGVAQCNISIIGNHFVSSQFGIESASNGACIPHGNLKIENNTFTNDSSLALQIEGSQSAACPRDNGLTITGNTVVPDSAVGGGAGGWYSCSITAPPCGAAMEISDYQNVTIANNQFLMQAGNPGYAANFIYTPSLSLQGDENVTIKDNGFNNGWNVWSTSGAQWAHTEYPNVRIIECGNAYGLTKPMPDDFTGTTPAASPRYDAAC